jgi:hypothetical protein
VHPVVNYHATASYHLPAGAAQLTTNHYKIFLIRVKYHCRETIKSHWLYYKICRKCCCCTHTCCVSFKEVGIYLNKLILQNL